MPQRLHFQIGVACLGLLALILLLASGATSGASTIVPAEGGSYTEAVVGHPEYLNPILSHFNDVDDDIVSLVFDGLTRTTETGEIVNALAEDWSVSPDGLVYTFQIRQDAYWHDGMRVTADDVVFTIESMRAPGYSGSPSVRDLWADVEVQKLDDFRVQFTLKDPFAPFLEYTTQGIIPRHLLGTVAPEALPAHPFNARPVGSGPFRVREASLREVVLEPNPLYYGPRPYLRRFTFRFFSTVDDALTALARGEVDGIRYVPPDRIDDLSTGHLQLLTHPELSKLTLLLFNTDDPVLGDVEVRRAIQAAIDRDRLIDVVLGGHGTAAFGPIFPPSWAYNPIVQDHGYDPDGAQRLLDNSGWRDEDGDGVRDRDGDSLHFVLLTNDRPERVTAAQEISRQLREVGIGVDVQLTGWTGLVQDFLAQRRFQMVLLEQWSPTVDPDVYQFWHSSQINGGLNFSGWSSPEVDEILERARRESDRDVRRGLYVEFQRRFVEDAPAVPLYYPNFTYALSRQLQGANLGLMLRWSDRFRTIVDWYSVTCRIAPNGIPLEIGCTVRST